MMSDNAHSEANVEYIRDLLSPYLDGEVSDEEKTLVEQAIVTSSELRRELESLRQTVALLSDLPPAPAPRPFTLPEAQVRPVTTAPRKSFWLSRWAPALAVVTATILCVAIVAGGLLFTTGQMTSEVAFAPNQEAADRAESTASHAAEAEQGGAAMEAAKEQPAGAQAVEEPAPAPPAAPELKQEEIIEEAESVEAPAQEEAASTEAEAELDTARQAVTDDTTSAGEAAQLAESRDGDESNVEKIVGNTEQPPALTPTATPSPVPQSTILPAPTPTLAPVATSLPETAGQAAPAQDGAAETAETTLAQSAPAAPAEAPPVEAPPVEAPPVEAPPVESQEESPPVEGQEEAQAEPQDQGLFYRDEIDRLQAGMRDSKLEVQPGLIRITGSLEAPTGMTLTASLQRNQRPFNEWADPATLRSTVQSDGRFSFAIRAQASRPDADLFASDPADYNVTITSIVGNEPISATLSFETFAQPAALAQITATPTVAPTATPLPTATPTTRPEALVSPATATPPLPQLLAEKPTDGSPWLSGSGVLILLIVLGLVGVVIWLKLSKKSY